MEELRRMASFFADRATLFGRQVVYLPEHQSSGVVWGGNGQVLSADGSENNSDEPLFTEQVDSAKPISPVSITGESDEGRWLVIVGHSGPGEGLTWSTSFDGGHISSPCGGVAIRELIVGTQLTSALTGAAVFDVDGFLAGIVARCDNTYRVISSASIPSLLQALDTPERKTLARWGFEAKALDEPARKLFGGDSGVWVNSVRLQSAADKAGLHPGDLILSVGEREAASTGDLWKGLNYANPPKLNIVRNRKPMSLTLTGEPASPAQLGLDVVTPVSAPVLQVRAGSAAYGAGLRNGDRVLQVGSLLEPTAAVARKLLGSSLSEPLLVVYERGSMRSAAVLTP